MKYTFNVNPNQEKCKNFIKERHYTKSCPPATYFFSIEGNDNIIGVCMFGRTARAGVQVPGSRIIIELSRLCIVDGSEPNTASAFISSCLNWLQENTNIESVVTFADPTEGHTGAVYKACNFLPFGSTSESYHYLAPSGERIDKRQVFNRAKRNGGTEGQQVVLENLVKVRELPKVKFAYHLIPNKHRQYVIYGLFDPTTGQLRYIGQTNNPKKRLRDHCRPANLKDNSYKSNWIKSLGTKKPIMQVLEIFDNPYVLEEHEDFYIEYFKSLGCKLTNSTKGGKGTIGYIHTPETRKIFSDSAKIHSKLRPLSAGMHVAKENILIDGVLHRECSDCKIVKDVQFFRIIKARQAYNGYCRPCETLRRANNRKITPPIYVKLSPEEYKESRIAAAKKGGLAMTDTPEKREAISKRNSKPIIAISATTGEILEFTSALKAKEQGFHNKLIGDAIKSKRPYKGYYWKLAVTVKEEMSEMV